MGLHLKESLCSPFRVDPTQAGLDVKENNQEVTKCVNLVLNDEKLPNESS